MFNFKARPLLPTLTFLFAFTVEYLVFPSFNIFFFLDKLILYFWLLYRPDLLSFLFATFLYLALDILQGWPLGFNPLLVFAFCWFIMIQRQWVIKKSFSLQWLFLGGGLTFYIISFSTLAFFIGDKWPSFDIFTCLIYGILLYPLVCKILYHFYLAIPTYTSVEV